MTRAGFLVALVLFAASPALGRPKALTIAPHCKATTLADLESFGTGFCMGVIFEIIDFAESHGICPPSDYTIPKAMEIVSSFAIAHPKVLDSDFDFVAYVALQSAWPCKK